MCRLFGFHSQTSVNPPQDSVTPFVELSHIHKDGWGMAHYQGQQAHLNRALLPAKDDPAFMALIQELQTPTLLAHLRLATVGENKLQNNHPFQYQDWTFAHNGNIKHFARYRQLILSQITPHFQAVIAGDTDSELIFYFILSELERWGLVSNRHGQTTSRQLGQTVKWALENLLSLIGPFLMEKGPPTETYISFLMTNGQVMLAHQGGQPLYYHMQHQGHQLESIRFSSQPLGAEDDWVAMATGELIAVDQSLQVYGIRGYSRT